LTLFAVRRLHLAKFERAILALLLASNALCALPAADKPGAAAIEVSHPLAIPNLQNASSKRNTSYHILHALIR
jgi:hypothetical protein